MTTNNPIEQPYGYFSEDGSVMFDPKPYFDPVLQAQADVNLKNVLVEEIVNLRSQNQSQLKSLVEIQRSVGEQLKKLGPLFPSRYAETGPYNYRQYAIAGKTLSEEIDFLIQEYKRQKDWAKDKTADVEELLTALELRTTECEALQWQVEVQQSQIDRLRGKLGLRKYTPRQKKT